MRILLNSKNYRKFCKGNVLKLLDFKNKKKCGKWAWSFQIQKYKSIFGFEDMCKCNKQASIIKFKNKKVVGTRFLNLHTTPKELRVKELIWITKQH